MSLSTGSQFYSGGLAEIVDKPSKLTLSYIQRWFCTKHSLGIALSMLRIPYVKSPVSELILHNGELVVDLNQEENTLYKNTIFKYGKQKDINETPKLKVDFLKLLIPTCWISTLKLIYSQSYWISNATGLVNEFETHLKLVPVYETVKLSEIEEVLQNKVVPVVTAVGILNEYFYHLIKSEHEYHAFENIKLYIDKQIKEHDWFFNSYLDRAKVKDGKMTFTTYLRKYGFRADNDYELTCPRWYELHDYIKEQILEYVPSSGARITPHLPKMSLNKRSHIETYINLLLLRSESKKLMLIWIDQLRKALLASGKLDSTGLVEEITDARIRRDSKASKTKEKLKGRGIPLSAGIVQGRVKVINRVTDKVLPDSVCIFPTAGVKYSALFPRCKGIIFLKGGQTSHGAIVAREFGTPALTDMSAEVLKDGQIVMLDGGTGEWELK
jgi:phosphohistidine swiveling domain-containing protein